MVKRFFAYNAMLAAFFVVLSGCARVQAPERIDFFAMDTFMTCKAYGANAAEALAACEAEARRVETLLSVTSVTGDVYRINHAEGNPTRIAPETARMLSDALAVCAETDGAFDPTVYPLVECWGFLRETRRVPDEREIAAMLPLVGWDKISLSGDTVTLPEGAGLDLGGVAKGYATDRLAELLRQRGVQSALLSLGGNVYALGARPEGDAWRIAVQNPADANAIVGVVSARDMAVITSGSYQRNFTLDGVTYHHILDPKTGYPADNGLSSVTVICENAARADALSTALFVMGYERAISFWRADGEFAAIFVFSDGTVAYTENADFAPSVEKAHKIA